MATYHVRVRAEHLEDYYVDADSEQAARENWPDGYLDGTQCVEILGIESIELVEG